MTQTGKVLILGISGQDGSYLAKILSVLGYSVYGTSRNPSQASIDINFQAIQLNKKISILALNPEDSEAVYHIINELQPNYIFNMSGQTSVGKSFKDEHATYQSIVPVVENILNAIMEINPSIRFLNAGSGEMFDASSDQDITEDSEIKPLSPYAEAKFIAFNMIKNFRNKKKIFAATAILFNHESILRPDYFVTKKIITSAYQILNGQLEYMEVGNISIERDWGWAPEYADAMVRLITLDDPQDCIIASGQTISLKYFIESVFSELNLNYHNHIKINSSFFRPNEAMRIAANPNKITKLTAWKSSIRGRKLGKKLISEYLLLKQEKR